MHEWLNDEDRRNINRARSYMALSAVFLRVLTRMPKPVCFVCGPITTGGLGNVPDNLALFDRTIERLDRSGRNIANQLIFEERLRLLIDLGLEEDGYPLLEQFYRPVFDSGLFDTFYFIRGWESSRGASWEHAEAKRLGIKIVYL